MKNDKPKCRDCHDYEERAAIHEYLGKMQRQYAERMARESTCVGCVGDRGIDLLNRDK